MLNEDLMCMIISNMRTRDIITMSAVSRACHRCCTIYSNCGKSPQNYDVIQPYRCMQRWSNLALHVNLPQNFVNIPNSYIMAKSINIHNCQHITNIMAASNMDIVSIRNSRYISNFFPLAYVRNIDIAYSDAYINAGIFQKVEILRLNNCSNVAFGLMPSLQELYISYCPNIELIAQLRNLRRVAIIRLPDLRCVCDVTNLEHLTLQPCPAVMRNITKVRQFNVVSNSNVDVSEFSEIEHLKVYDAPRVCGLGAMNLEQLTLGTTTVHVPLEKQGSGSLLRILGSNMFETPQRFEMPKFDLPKNVKSVTIENCVLNVNLSPFGHLQCVSLRQVVGVDLGELSKVRVVSLVWCYDIVDLSPLREVQHLYLNTCPKIKDLSCLHKLRSLEIDSCESIREIPWLPRLKRIVAYDCPILQECESAIDPTVSIIIARCRYIPDISRVLLHGSSARGGKEDVLFYQT